MSHQALDRFLAEVQNRAFVTAKIATGNDDDALELVQDSFLKLVKLYSDKPAQEWPALFQRVLQNTLRDWYRRQKVRSILFWWQQHDLSEETMQFDALAVGDFESPQRRVQGQQQQHIIAQALQQLPLRQQQAFVLRAWWEHSTEETAGIMGCSVGSVKTHYSRALKNLQQQLGNDVLSADSI